MTLTLVALRSNTKEGELGPAMMILHNDKPGDINGKVTDNNEQYDIICGGDTPGGKILDREVSIKVNLAKAPGTPKEITRETMDEVSGEYFQVQTGY